MLFVANGYYQQETDIYNHLQDLGMFDVTIKKDYQIYGSTDLTVYDLIIITGFAPNIGYSATNNIKNSGIPVMIIEYWDFWYSYRMGLLNWDSGDYYGTDTVELIDDQHPISIGLDQEVEVYDESWAVLYGASINSLKPDTEPLIYSWQSANEAAVIVDDDRKMVATGIYDTTHYTDDAWEIFDQILGYLHPAGGIIAPLGYTSLEFIDMIETKLEFAQTYESNGIVMTSIEIDEPLIYKGESPKTEFVGLSESEMAELNISPGDEAADSTPFHRKFYMLATEQADDNGDEEGIDFENQIIPISANLGEYFKFWGWYGSGLVYGRDSYIEIDGSPSVSIPSMPGVTIEGYARFTNSQGFQSSTGIEHKTFPVYLPAQHPTQKVTTVYAQWQMVVQTTPKAVWVVYKGDEWGKLGEDGWDEIDLGGNLGPYFSVDVTHVRVVHNSMEIVNADTPGTEIDDLNPEFSLLSNIEDYRDDLIFGSNNPVIKLAVSDYAQGAQYKYPVFPGHLVAKDASTPQRPVQWCTEFGLWPLKTAYPALITEVPAMDLPDSEFAVNLDIGVRDLRQWLGLTTAGPGGTDSRFVFFGDDSHVNGGGPSIDEWGCLAGFTTVLGAKCSIAGYHVIGAGDLVTKRQCKDSACTGMTGHTMMVIGWTDEGKTGVGATYFNKNRDFNWILVIEGNANPEDQRGTEPIPGKGLTRVAINRKLVCQKLGSDPLATNGDYRWVVPLPPEPPYNKKCDIILRDTHPLNFDAISNINGELEGSFFGNFN